MRSEGLGFSQAEAEVRFPESTAFYAASPSDFGKRTLFVA